MIAAFHKGQQRAAEKIGRLSRRVKVLTPVSTMDAVGGEKIQWVEWLTVWAAVQSKQQGSGEEVQADRRVAEHQRFFYMRFQSVPGVNEKMIIALDGEQYDIDYLSTVEAGPRNQYREMIGIRRETTVNAVQFLDNNLYMDFAQSFQAVTATEVTVTAGALLNPATKTADEIHQLGYLFVDGIRLTYGASGSIGYTIDAATNKLLFNQKQRGANILYHQYQTTA